MSNLRTTIKRPLHCALIDRINLFFPMRVTDLVFGPLVPLTSRFGKAIRLNILLNIPILIRNIRSEKYWLLKYRCSCNYSYYNIIIVVFNYLIVKRKTSITF